ncbi:Nucleoside-diphosphate-sugar epimerase [Streptomyces sp. 1222.5]|uniref:NAD-dependent epimerase/dehydratase family protein n=1 Tax=unclassified Streptomyces TaxID=2593676 RepID=UPI00089C4F3A|nr:MULTISPECIES: NAD-dependent epimerase/dehydratase family protein [unclassified Streptomyces]PKW07399.1 nucleoside-diphosphate-sugar epimerase [Streptomyces sp. 5112.2]SEC89877.1 Nucleoside-diphosphate-sugar epimerase [Streptomyces sp. 1222.5]
MRLLVLGGTEFVGRAVVEAACARGWEVTVLHRGRHRPPAGVRSLHGDRTAPDGLAALAADTGTWDVVVDTWSAAPRAVLEAARLLHGRAGRYVYLSSRSVYAWPWPSLDGPAGAGAPVEGAAADAGATDYPRDKRGGELAAVGTFGERDSLLVRAGLILGPHENIGRLPWWLTRIARGGPVLAPGPRELAVSFIDARDLADWVLAAAEQRLSGPYDLAGPPGHTTMGKLLDACVRVTGADAELRWTDPKVILDAGVEPWTGLPVWVPPDDELYGPVHRADVSRALAAGLVCRPAEETVADTWRWLTGIGGVAPRRPDRPPVGVDPEVEAKVLAAAGGVPGTTSEEGASGQ